MSSTTNYASATMIVIFGRSGAGKSTVANAAIDMLSKSDKSIHCIGLDLDICVPEWMRDNFGKGIYPTLEERAEFAHNACDYVETKLAEQRKQTCDRPTAAIISFSFVNTDLRDVFRSRFPGAIWALVDTTQAEADERIKTREGHFYKGAPPNTTPDKADRVIKKSDKDNSEWEFAPVAFPHMLLPGNVPIEANAQKMVERIQREVSLHREKND